MAFPFVISLFSWVLFLFFQVHAIYPGDGGDLVTAAYLGGVPHPPGYPFYTALGWLVTRLPLFTIVWRASLLSSIPHAISVYLAWLLVYTYTKNKFAASYTAFLIIGNYLFFLLSITPEVFALFDLFFISVLYLVFRNTDHAEVPSLQLLVGVFVAGILHHQVLLFLLPALLYWVVASRNISLIAGKKYIVRTILACLFPFLFLLYLPLAGGHDAVINWDRPVTVSQFIRLITRADYGTFVSSGVFGSTIKERFYAIVAFFQFVLFDFRAIGLILSIVGLWKMLKTKRILAIFLLLAFVFLGPGFFFYASFPLFGRFALGTFERFLLPSYLILAVLMGVGVYETQLLLQRFLRIKIPTKKAHLYAIFASWVLLIYPITTLSMSLWRFWGIRTDKTAEFMAQDILASAPQDAIIFLASDTPLFATQFVRYGLQARPDTVVVHASRLNAKDYHTVLKKNFPALRYPDEESSAYMRDLILKNAETHPILANVPFPIGDDFYWVPHGLLFRATKSDVLPDASDLISTNQVLWNGFHDPKSGILSRYPHLMLTDVLDTYSKANLEYGNALFRAEKMEEAKLAYQKAVDIGGDAYIDDAYVMLSVTQMYLKDCNNALYSIEKAKEFVATDKKLAALVESITYRDCVGDSKKAEELFGAYQQLQKESEQPLDQL